MLAPPYEASEPGAEIVTEDTQVPLAPEVSEVKEVKESIR
jgi:hypothetical protein